MKKQNHITGILLAAGMGSRFGGDKLLHALEGDLEIGLRSALNLKAHVDRVICVVRPSDHALKTLYRKNGFTVIENPQHLQGLSTSFIAGIHASPNSDYWMLALADMPFIQHTTYEQLIQRLPELPHNSPPIIRPRLIHQGSSPQAGHPVLFPQCFKGELLNLKGDSGAKALFKAHPEQINWLDTSDHGIMKDIDTRHALAQA